MYGLVRPSLCRAQFATRHSYCVSLNLSCIRTLAMFKHCTESHCHRHNMFKFRRRRDLHCVGYCGNCEGVAEGFRQPGPMGVNSSTQNKARNVGQRSVNPTLDYPFLQDESTAYYINGSKVMFIMRGLSGSGKTTLVRAIKEKYGRVIVCSSDNFFMSNGVYRFDRFRLPDAHDWCKRRALRSCENNTHNIVVVDNTNIQLWEFEHYLEVAKENNFAVVIVEPKTSWRWDANQLEKKNIHNIPAVALKKKLDLYEDVCPEYFGWFLNEADTQMLLSIAQAYLDEFSHNSDFVSDFAKWAPNLRDLKTYFFNSSYDQTHQISHCTSHYVGDQCDTDEYSRRKAVLKSCGKVYTLHVVGFIVTPRTFGARLQLDDGALTLWNQNDTEGRPGGCDDLVNGMSQLRLQEKNFVSKKKKNVNCTIPTLHWTGKVHYEKRFNPTSGRGSRAHMTLGCASDAKAVETGYDLVNVIQCEKKANNKPPQKLFHIHEGVAGTHGKGQWVVYLNKQIKVKALFTGSY